MDHFDRKKYYGKILTLAFPVILSQAGQILVQLADNVMVGRLGATPLAGVSFANSVFFMVFVLGMGLSFGLTPLTGEVFAVGKFRKTADFLKNSILFYSLIGILIFIIATMLIPFMHRMGQPEDVVAVAKPYYFYIALSVIPFMIFASFKQFLEGIGNTKVAMCIIIISNAINILFNWLLIYGHWGFTAMGASGAGVATLISRIITPFMVVFWFFRRDSFKRYFKLFTQCSISRNTIASLVKVGSPIAVQMFMEGSAFALTSIMMGWISTADIAGNQIATVISNFAFMILIGIGSAVTICVSHAYGHRNWTEIKRYAGSAYRLGLIWNAITATVFILFRRLIPTLFSSDPAVIDSAAVFIIFAAIFQISDGLQANSIAILRGIQDVTSIMWISFVCYIIICLPLGYWLAFHTGAGAAGLWLALIIGLAAAALFYGMRYLYQIKRLSLNDIKDNNQF